MGTEDKDGHENEHDVLDDIKIMMMRIRMKMMLMVIMVRRMMIFILMKMMISSRAWVAHVEAQL